MKKKEKEIEPKRWLVVPRVKNLEQHYVEKGEETKYLFFLNTYLLQNTIKV